MKEVAVGKVVLVEGPTTYYTRINDIRLGACVRVRGAHGAEHIALVRPLVSLSPSDGRPSTG